MTNSEPKGCLTALFGLLGISPKAPITNIEPEPETNDSPYGLKSGILSAAELSFYLCLKQVVKEDYQICPLVRLADILFVHKVEKKQGFQNKINSKHLDFVLCCPKTLAPILAIELDDSTHQTNQKTIDSDTFKNEALKSASLKLVRIKAAKNYSLEELRMTIHSEILTAQKPLIPTQSTKTPLCPQCGVAMVRRNVSKGKNKGKPFWGCVNYPNCRATSSP